MRKNKNSSSDPGAFKTGAYFAVIAVIAVKTLKALLNTLVKTYDGIQKSRTRTQS